MAIDWSKADEDELTDEQKALAEEQYGVDWSEADKEPLSRDETLKAMQNADPKLGFARAGLNFPGDVKEAATGLWDAVTNPKQTAEGAGALLQAQRGVVDPRMAMAAKEGVEEFAEDPVEAMIQNPFDTAMVAAGGTGVKMLDPLAATGKLIQKLSKPAAEATYGSTLKIPKIAPDTNKKEIVERGLSEEIPVTVKGHEKIAGKKVDGEMVGGLKQRIGADIDDMIKQADKDGTLIPTYQINQYLHKMMKDLGGTSGGIKNIELVKNMKNDLYKEFGNRFFIKPSELQHFKKNIYQQVYEARTDAARKFDQPTKVKQEQGRGAKKILSERVPEMDEVNTRYGELAELEPWIAKRVNMMNEIADPSTMKMITNTLSVPGFRSKLGIYLNRLANGDLGKLEAELNNQELRTLLAIAGASNAEE